MTKILAEKKAEPSAAQEVGDVVGAKISPLGARAARADAADVSLVVDEADAAGVVEDILATLTIEPAP